LTSTFSNMHTLDQLLLERFGGKVGRGLALELCGREHFLKHPHASLQNRTVLQLPIPRI